MRRAVLVASLVMVLAPLRARAQVGPAVAQSSDLEQLQQRVSALEERVSALEGRPTQDADHRTSRADTFARAVNDLGEIQSALTLGQTDVVQALQQVQSSVGEAARDLGDADQTERAHVEAAVAAVDAAVDAVGREDLYTARGAVDVARMQLSRARDVALAR